MDSQPPQDNDTLTQINSLKKIVLATVISAAFALVILLAVVLPAEFGVDPLGTGRALGLLDLADASAGPLEHAEQAHKTDRTEFILEPFQSVEYKYYLQEGHSMVFSWAANGDLVFDMHADPEGMVGEEGVESYEQSTANASAGVYRANFTGIHGWFWENRSFDEVTIRLESAGFYDSAIVFRDGGSFERELGPVL